MSSFQLERLESLLRSVASANDPEVRKTLDRLHSELLQRASSSSPESIDFFLRSFRSIKALKGNGNSAVRIACLRQCILYFFHHAKFDLALEAASHQHSVAEHAESTEARQRSLNSMGTALAELGNVHQALIHYSDALEIARQRQSNEDQAIVLNNIGTALNYANLYRDAIPCFETSLKLAPTTSPISKKSSTNLAQSLYYLERFDEALDAIRQALGTKSSPSNTSEHFDRALREFTAVQIALELGRSGLALEHSMKCSQHAIAAKSISRTLMAGIAAARCEVRIGDTRRGIDQLDRLVMECMKIDSMYKDALIAAVKANDEAGDPDRALSYMERLLKHVRQRRLDTVHSLLTTPVDMVQVRSLSADRSDLSRLEQEHFHLRARVAERHAAISTWEMLERLAITADIKEEASGEHGYRVGRLSALLAARMGWTDERAQTLELAARLHDIGKVAIPDRILGSSGALRNAERHFMCMHTEVGAELLAQSQLPQIKLAQEVARHHHEWWDGSGYPDRLRGNQIPIHARIVAIADVFDALTHGRPFAAPWTVDRAISELVGQRGTHFDPHVTDLFIALISELRLRHAALDTFLSEAVPKSPFLQVRNRIRTLLDEERVRASAASLQ